MCLTAQPVIGQTIRYGNEWINPRQTYLKIPVAASGRYRISFTTLQQAGVPVSTLLPRQFQLFWRGQEIPVRIEGDTDNRFDPDDYIEFTGQANDGLPDSALYRPHRAQPHPFYSLYSDTTAFFLTWRLDTLSGKRESLLRVSPAYTRAESRTVLTTDYPAGMIYPLGAGYNNGVMMSHYDVGEGWTGPVVSGGKRAEQAVRLSQAIWHDDVPAEAEWQFAGRKAGTHRVQVFIGDSLVGNLSWRDYMTATLRVVLQPDDITDQPVLRTAFVVTETGDEVSLSYLRVFYGQEPAVSLPVQFVSALLPVRFRQIDPASANYLIITHPMLRAPTTGHADAVESYAAYRASKTGGGYDTLTIAIGEVFDQFNFGERSPLAIRRFVRYMASGGRLPMLFLMGQSVDPQRVRKLANAARTDLIPNGGWPGSDTELVNVSETETPAYAMPVGRLPADRPEQVAAYLKKVKDYEAEPPARWQKRVLHLSGGRTREELLRFRQYVEAYEAMLASSALSLTVQTMSKQTDAPVEQLPVADAVNRGVRLISLFGHSSLDVADVDLGFVSDDRLGYQNQGRYPFLLVNGCAAGNVFFGQPTYGTDWVLTPDRGGIGFLAHTHNGFSAYLNLFSTTFYEVLTDSVFSAVPVGRQHLETIRRYLARNHSFFDRANAQQYLLQGDPAIRLLRFDHPEPEPETARDPVPPLLDVAFDGRRPEADDLVAPQPEITVQVIDDDRRLVRTDTTNLQLYLQADPALPASPFRRLSLRNARWTVSADHVFTLSYRPETPWADGTYRFEVHARDLSGNRATPYRVQFRVLSGPESWSVQVAPNPVGPQTCFRLTVSGSVAPAAVLIRITDLTGRLVSQLSPGLHIGKNEYYWNRTNFSGEPLSAGVYLYQIRTGSRVFSGRLMLE
ncbi:hypothetical protein BLX24_08775 [Arsenicibacter rosenii]|uniref:Gingipain domain-containing protein n=1 Tax=Arsenicibacter rosenii TaxID=1750698 RepID=A0A1S2VME3_9BACT|nr:hypothetical protein BLX24_08775 [Arsenicibacter rosenii]